MKGVTSIFSEEQTGPHTHSSAKVGEEHIFLHFLVGQFSPGHRLAAEAVILPDRVPLPEDDDISLLGWPRDFFGIKEMRSS